MVTTLNPAMGDCKGSAEMFEHVEHRRHPFCRRPNLPEGSGPSQSQNKLRIVQVSTLDKVFEGATNTLEPEILIKMDVQGFEARVIKRWRADCRVRAQGTWSAPPLRPRPSRLTTRFYGKCSSNKFGIRI